jgi:hypothetical protein
LQAGAFESLPQSAQALCSWARKRKRSACANLFPRIWCPRRDSNPHTSRHMDLNHARLPIPPRGHWTALPVLLDVAVEFRYDIRLCHFALDQLSFDPGAHRLRSIFVSGWAVSEETESIADGWQMSKGLRAGHSLHASRPTLGESAGPPLHYACLRVNVTISAPSYRWTAPNEKITEKIRIPI